MMISILIKSWFYNKKVGAHGDVPRSHYAHTLRRKGAGAIFCCWFSTEFRPDFDCWSSTAGFRLCFDCVSLDSPLVFECVFNWFWYYFWRRDRDLGLHLMTLRWHSGGRTFRCGGADDFWFRIMNFVVKMMNAVVKMMKFWFKMMNLYLKWWLFRGTWRAGRRRASARY